jgi:chemotaxis protein methyltransferase CheR
VIKLQGDEARVLAQYVYTLCGIHLDETKNYLIENRLVGLLKETQSASFSELYLKAKSDPTRALPRRIIDAVTTGETSFYRDLAPFELLKHKLIPELVDRRRKASRFGAPISIRVWSAACSTGQEIYTIAITLRELLGKTSEFDFRLLGTDISDQAVMQASAGIYNDVEIQRGLGPEQIKRYFTRVDKGWKISEEIRAMASFRRFNLLDDFSLLGSFDIIFCRNVAIYFTENDKRKLFERIERALQPDGALIIGSTESLSGISPQFEAMRHLRGVYYRRKGMAGL